MSPTPVPRLGEVFSGRDTAGRALRVSAHPGRGRVVLSVWQDGTCLATVRLTGDDVRRLADVLALLGAELDAVDDRGLPQAG